MQPAGSGDRAVATRFVRHRASLGTSDPGWHLSGSQVFLQSRYISDPSLDCRNSVSVAGEGSCR